MELNSMVDYCLYKCRDIQEQIGVFSHSLLKELEKVWGACTRLQDNVGEIAFTHLSNFGQEMSKFAAIVVCFIVAIIFIKKVFFRHKKLRQPPLPLLDHAKRGFDPVSREKVISAVRRWNYDVNYAVPQSGLSLFLCACLSGDRTLATYLLDRGGDTTSRTVEGDGPLYLATYGVLCSVVPDAALLTDLINAGCSVNERNARGYTSLHRAASKGNAAVIKCLLASGADIRMRNNFGVYPMDSAVNAGHMDVAELVSLKVSSPYVWDIIQPHTPPKAKMGLLSPSRKHLMKSPLLSPKSLAMTSQPEE